MMSLIYSRKKVVDNLLPCGIPSVIFCVFDFAFCVWVDCNLSLKYVSMKDIVLGVKLKSCLSFRSSFRWDTVSYAFDRSIYIAVVACLFSFALWSLLMMVCNASVVLEFGLKAYCVLDSMLCFMACSIIWLFISWSKIFAMMGSIEMGR